ncbi:probable metal-nicotianamine transporter YSL7 [Impatiens glandulifera]|uniref:probable metal-nicotianamine transporter YSL7 n=1 Tax=Impatiens glandulifera TaxID=253017 RepID=UPI001FB0A85F|nr:probable metal-nicotianamine transporter YSL7 [Impatiens glandulifera]
MSEAVAKNNNETAYSNNIKNPKLGWMIGFLFIVSFVGLFCVLPLRKIMIIDLKLVYPSGTATAHLINSIHTPRGTKLAKKQVKALGKFLSLSFLWSFFQWFFTGGNDCGFSSFPTFGLKAYQNKFYFDFSSTYVGVGMICPHIVNVSLLLGGILSWGIIWPLIEDKKGDWYSATFEQSSLHGLQGYRVFIAIAIILGDGLYNFLKVLAHISSGLYRDFFLRRRRTRGVENIPSLTAGQTFQRAKYYYEQERTQLFLKDDIPSSFAVIFYCGIAVISSAVLPHIFPQLRWYYIAVIYVVSPVLAFCNAYGSGLTDWTLTSTYGKLAIFLIGAWAGASHGGGGGGVLAGLAACGVMMNIVSTASDLMQDFKTGYMTLTSPRSMFVSQVIGTAMGCVISPCVFLLFDNAIDDLGIPNSEYPAPYATIYRSISILGVKGFSSLPKHCLTLCFVFFAGAVGVNVLRDWLGSGGLGKYIPLPMVMAVPFYLGTYFGIDMCVGSLVMLIWKKLNRAKADELGPAVASGLICGDGLWTIPSSLLSVTGVKPPICMNFLDRKTKYSFDRFLSSPTASPLPS